MKFIYGKNDWKTLDRGQENCYLITNGLGGYSSLTMIGSNSRNDHALLMACTVAPNHRYHLITRMDEVIELDKEKFSLSSQEYVNHAKNQLGYRYLNQFMFEYYPVWVYQVEGIEINKTVLMAYGENTIGIRYVIHNDMNREVKLTITPQLQFIPKGDTLSTNQIFEHKDNAVISNGIKLNYLTNGKVTTSNTQYTKDLYYGYDARDGREAIGVTASNHNISVTVTAYEEKVLDIIYSTDSIAATIEQMIENESNRLTGLVKQSGIKNEIGKQLVKSADQFWLTETPPKERPYGRIPILC